VGEISGKARENKKKSLLKRFPLAGPSSLVGGYLLERTEQAWRAWHINRIMGKWGNGKEKTIAQINASKYSLQAVKGWH